MDQLSLFSELQLGAKPKETITLQANKAKRDSKMHARFEQLYKLERKRIDDVYELLADEFDMSNAQVRRRLQNFKPGYWKKSLEKTEV